jgi:hypothetical protein
LQFVHLFCNQSKCILLFFSCISSLLLAFFASVKASSVFIRPSCLVCIQFVVYGLWSRLFCVHKWFSLPEDQSCASSLDSELGRVSSGWVTSPSLSKFGGS